MMKQLNQKPSQAVKAFLDFVDYANSEYDYSVEAMRNEEKITQDYLHMLVDKFLHIVFHHQEKPI